ncbi:MAG TPA: monovalent cation/H+ antiporter complex subunit F [Pseudonocardiaceae bacterium]|nr:monovalent cation/H+ antiporter complex subunit F [Pseudonocardiaceae bacterium]
MNWWLLAAVVLVVGGFAPALYLTSRGAAVERLIGMELAGAVAVLVLLLLAQGFGQPQYLIVPLVLVLLSFAGTLVFTRLLGTRS